LAPEGTAALEAGAAGTTAQSVSPRHVFRPGREPTGRVAVVGDDLGGAAAALVAVVPAVQGLVAVTAHVAVSEGRAHEGGRRGEEGALHAEEQCKASSARSAVGRKSKECPLNE